MSADKRPPNKSAKSLISEEDRALWRYVVRDVARLDRTVRRASVTDAQVSPSRTEPPMAGAEPRTAGRPAAVQRSAPSIAMPTAVPRQAVPSGGLAMFERKRARKVAKGRLAIDARLDLHGMRQADAHDALIFFLGRAVARGCRTVLVITGKGGAGEGGREAGVEARGVLRRNVPRWLSEPHLARHVVSYTEAHTRHGGAGALYIHLRVVGPARDTDV